MVPVPNFSSLEGRVVLITGGAGHIGSALADGFLAVGCSVATADLADPEHPIGRDTARFMHTTVDLTDTGSSAALVDETVERYGRLDVIVTAASWMGTDATPGWNAPFAEQDEGLWSEVLQVGATSVFSLVQHAAPHLANSSDGSVVLISSIYGFCAPQPAMYQGTGINNIAGYAASKGAVGQLARWLSTTLAPDVRVNSVSPGGVFRDQEQTFVERYVERTPLGRMATEDDLVGPVLFLASDLSRYVTGHDLVVDGGFSVW